MTWRKTEDLAGETKSLPRLLSGMIRRMAVTLSDAARWQLLGQRGGQGGDETVTVENFSGVGFYARPPSSGKPEAITVSVGGAKTTVIVATRDEQTRAAMAGGLGEDEAAVFNSLALVYVKADGTVEVRLANGTAVALALKTDVEAVDAKYDGHIHADSTSAPTSGPEKVSSILPNPSAPPTYLDGTPLDPAEIVGTTVLKGQ